MMVPTTPRIARVVCNVPVTGRVGLGSATVGDGFWASAFVTVIFFVQVAISLVSPLASVRTVVAIYVPGLLYVCAS